MRICNNTTIMHYKIIGFQNDATDMFTKQIMTSIKIKLL